MFQIAAYETFQDGQIVFEEGSSGDWVYEIDAGTIELSRTAGGQREIGRAHV
jgi:CRP-like cAMP-binding protein